VHVGALGVLAQGIQPVNSVDDLGRLVGDGGDVAVPQARELQRLVQGAGAGPTG
jgi:hypothetical protein